MGDRRDTPGKAPWLHEWKKLKPGVWRCPWCEGYFRSELRPDPNAIAKEKPNGK